MDDDTIFKFQICKSLEFLPYLLPGEVSSTVTNRPLGSLLTCSEKNTVSSGLSFTFLLSKMDYSVLQLSRCLFLSLLPVF